MQAKTPADITRKVHDDSAAALAHPSVNEGYHGLAAVIAVAWSTPMSARRHLRLAGVPTR